MCCSRSRLRAARLRQPRPTVVRHTIYHYGILIGRVQKGGPAYRTGIHAGDVLVSLNGRATLSQAAFDSVLASLKPKLSVKATVVGQGGKSRTVTIHLDELPVSAS